MPIYLRQSTASQEVPLGYFVDDTDGKTAETALTIANTDIKLWLSGATTLASKNSGGATHISGGVYYCVLDATDTATIGPLVIFVAVSGALAVRVECVVLDEAVYDVLFGTTAPSTYAGGRVAANVDQINGTSIAGTGTRVADAFVSLLNVATPALTVASVNQTGDNYARIGAAGAGLTDLGGMSTTMKAQVNAEADTALADAKAAYAAAIEAAILDEGDATALLAAIAAKVEDFILNEGDSRATLAAIAAAVWAAATRTLTAGTNIVLAKGTGVTGFNDLSAAQVNAEADTALSDYDGPTNAEMLSAFTSLSSHGDSAWATATGFAVAGSAMTLTSGERDSIATALLDLANGTETGKTVRQALRLMAAALAGKRSNAGTSTEQYDAIGAPGTARIVGNLDADGNGTPTLTP